jgi:ferredoxin-NADP reductase
MGMATQSVRLEGRDNVAEGTTAFHFSKPAGFEFKPGQAIDLVLPALEVSQPDASRHAFSIVSAPHEPRLTVATRMRDSVYKRALGKLSLNAPAAVDGPFGSLTLHKDMARDAIFVAGGIGITPFMSMLRHAARNPPAQTLVLVYSNRRPEDSAFFGELQDLAQRPNIRLVATMTGMSRSAVTWDGASRVVDAALIQAATAGLSRPIAYLAGPPAMVAAMRPVLVTGGIDEDDIRSEEFFGY